MVEFIFIRLSEHGFMKYFTFTCNGNIHVMVTIPNCVFCFITIAILLFIYSMEIDPNNTSNVNCITLTKGRGC